MEVLKVSSHLNMKNYDPKAVIGVYTDASDKYWGAVVTQDHKEGPSPMAFTSGHFNAGQRSWTINDKECFAIVSVVKRFDYIVINHHNVEIRTDHRNFAYLFSPPRGLRSSTLGRISRWGLFLQDTGVVIKTIPGVENVLADLLSRWEFPASVRCLKAGTVARNEKEEWADFMNKRISFLHPASTDEPYQVTLVEIRRYQEHEWANRPKKGNFDNDHIFRDEKQRIWIPRLLVPRFIYYKHITRGHPSINDEVLELRRFHMKVSNLDKVIKELHTRCLHCMKRPRLIRRPYYLTWRAKVPNEVIHGDFIKIETSYILLFLDNFSRKVELFPAERATAEEVAKALL